MSDTFPIDEAVYQLLPHEWRLELLSTAAKFMGKPDAAADICSFVMEACEQKTDAEKRFKRIKTGGRRMFGRAKRSTCGAVVVAAGSGTRMRLGADKKRYAHQ